MIAAFFPSRNLTLYMAKMLLVRTFAFLIVVTLVMQTLDLLGETGNVLAYPGNGNAELWRYVTLRFPQLVAEILPFSVLLGTIATFFTLNQSSEIISMKAAGLSAHQILAPSLLASLLIAIISFVFNDMVVVQATATLAHWESVAYGPMPPNTRGQDNVYVKAPDALIHVDLASGRGVQTRLTNVTIYQRKDNALTALTQASAAVPIAAGWKLLNVRVFDVASGTVHQLNSSVAMQGITPDQFTLATVKADRLPLTGLDAAIGDLRAAGRPTAALEAGWWHKISGPLSAMLMPLLGSVAAFGLARSGRLFMRAVIAMMLGFAYFVADNAALAMGNIGVYPPLLAAWGPYMLFLLIGEAVLFRTEE